MSYSVLEEVIVKNILKYLNSLPQCWCFKVHGGPYQRKGIPDILGVFKGQLFALEVKRPGEKATDLQKWCIVQIRNAGGLAEVVTSVEQVQELLHV